MKKRIGLFGGTFDPIHKGHVALAERFLEHMLLDEVWFLVTPQNPWKKDTNLTDDAFRLSMVKESLKNHTRLIASDYEFNLPKPSYTYQTLRRLRAEYPDTEFIILIGADNWVKFDHWAEAAEILKNHRLAVYPRKEYDVDEAAMPEGVTFFNTEFYDVSSTQIRDMISRGENITALVPEGVAPMLYEKYGKKTMKTAVVILNWNGAKMMRRFLPYVVQHTMKEAEVWVVDNASTDDSLELLRTSFPTVKTLAFQKNWGYAYGYNKAIDTIDADYFVLLNSDVECSPGWLEPLVRCLDDNPDVVAVQPKLLQAYMDTPAENITEPTFEYAGAAGGFVDKFGYPYCRGRLFDVVEKDHGQYDSAIDIHWATGACLVVRAEEYKKAGGLDGRFFAHCEEIDLCWRLRIAGWRIMCVPESRVYHLGGGTLPQGNPRKTYLNFRNNLTMIYKNIPEQRLKSVMRIRRLLDYVAMLQSLVKGNLAEAKAIWNARRDFRNWKHSFQQDRTDIQTNRRMSADRDLAPLSLLWQFFALGRKTWDKLPSVIIVLLMLFNAFIMQADDKTRGIGVYPGRVSDDFSVFTEPSDEYRNIAKNHAAYASSSFDHNLTAQLATDGFISGSEPPRIQVFVNGVFPSKREREWLIDGIKWTATTLVGEHSKLKLLWSGMTVKADSVVLNYIVAYHADKATEGYAISISDAARVLSCAKGDGLPGEAMKWQIPSDPNKQSDYTETLPARKVSEGMKLDAGSPLSELRISLDMPGAEYWKLQDMDFYYKGKRLYSENLPSSLFRSAWMSAEGGRQWVYVDLGARSEIDKVRLYWLQFSPKGEVQVSDDAQNWTRVASLPADENLAYELNAVSTCRYVRVLVDGADIPYTLSEMEVYGRGGTVACHHSEAGVDGNLWLLNGGEWYVQRADGGDNWIPATVPGTVLTSYVNAGAVSNPNYDDNIFHTSESFFNSDFVYRREFTLPDTFKGKRVFLNLDGINWKAQVVLNGKRVGRVEGAFMRGRFDVTDALVAGRNVLVIEIEKVAHPGSVKTKNAYNTDTNGGLLGLDNPTFHASIGWDWISTVRGRNIGIWNDVSLTAEDAVTLADPLVTTTLSKRGSLATLSPKVIVHNNVGREVRGTLNGWIGDITFAKTVTLDKEMEEVAFSPSDFKQLNNRKMRLWWPNGYGEPYLYDAGFAFIAENGDTLSTYHFLQGIREISYKDEATQLKFYVNGRRVVPLGGNWGFAEHNLNYRGREYDTAVRYHRDMHFNMIRNWVGQTGDKEFYDACDKYGIMVWQDFWLANPSDGPDPADEAMFVRNAKDYVHRIRRHASVVLYCGRNEGYPPATLNATLKKIVAEQHSDLCYIPSSADDGVSGHGPYWAIPAKEYFEKQTGKFHTERGMPNMMTYEGLKRTLRTEHLWQQNDFWGQHDYTMAGAQRGATFNELVARYGTVDSAEKFTSLAQFVNYDGYRAMFESQNIYRQGLLIWMSHACWPSMTWQCYDYYFEPTAAYFACKKACELLHIQYNASTSRPEVVNLGIGDRRRLKAEVCAYDINGGLLKRTVEKVDALNDATLDLNAVNTDGVALLRMRLIEKKNVLSENTYLLDASALGTVEPVTLNPKVLVGNGNMTVTIDAPADAPAYMVRLNMLDGSGEQILPVIYEDNYFHLLPGERRTLNISWLAEDQHAEGVQLEVAGFNARKIIIK